MRSAGVARAERLGGAWAEAEEEEAPEDRMKFGLGALLGGTGPPNRNADSRYVEAEPDMRTGRIPGLNPDFCEKPRSSDTDRLGQMLELQAASGGGRSGDLSALIQLETLKLLQKMSGRRGEEESEGEEPGGPGGDPSLVGALGGTGNVRGFDGTTRLRRDFELRPSKLIREYVGMAMVACRATDLQRAFHLTDYNREIQASFHRAKGMLRIHYTLQHVLHLICFQSKTAQATALCCQLSKAIFQSVLDGGQWHTAALLLPITDPIAKIEFGGTFAELQGAASYRKAMAEMKASHVRQSGGGEEDYEGGGDGEGAYGRYTGGPAAKRKAAAAAKRAAASSAAATGTGAPAK
jgi:hypothetical protein